jgi:CRISPR-associated protein Cas1
MPGFAFWSTPTSTAFSITFPLPESLGFEERNRRPPKDPVNALLSLCYVVLGAELQALLDGMGFDPYLGVFHDLDYGRPSLALDLLEEFRPAIVDRFVIELVNLRVLEADDFSTSPEDGVVLALEGKRTFFRRWEEWLATPFTREDEATSPRQLFRRQAERLARAIVDGEPYEGFRLPC